jgi:enoyl-CoA hydratase/carnithine racemase
MTELVTTTTRNGVADVRLNRGEKYNALSGEMFRAIIGAGERLMEARDVRAVVLSGNGPGFCSGLDFESFQAMATAGAEGGGASKMLARDTRPENAAQRPAYIWKQLPMPVIAAIHGVAYGGGCQIAMGADIRIAAPDAKLSVMEVKWGLVPDMSITQTLRDYVRLDVAKELTFSGRIINGIEAQALGLVTRVAENPRAVAIALAKEIASKSPDAVRAGKKLFEKSWHADAKDGLAMEALLQSRLIGTTNQIEAVKASFEKRRPQFTDPD